MRHPPDVRPGNGTNYQHCDTNGGDPLNRGLNAHETNLAEKVAMLVCSSSIDQGDKRPRPPLGHILRVRGDGDVDRDQRKSTKRATKAVDVAGANRVGHIHQ